MIPLILIALLTVLAGYVLIFLPNRWRIPLHEALELIQSDNPDDLTRADHLLSQALTNGIRGDAMTDARFAQAYARARLARFTPSLYGTAASGLADLAQASGHNADSAFLALWIQSRVEHHDQVLDLYARHSPLLADSQAAKALVAISAMRKAIEHWQRGEVSEAARSFDQVRELGELDKHLPPHLNDLHLLDGIQAAFDDRTHDARTSFTHARQRAAERQTSTAEADLALLTCAWKSATQPPGTVDPETGTQAPQAPEPKTQDRRPSESEAQPLEAPEPRPQVSEASKPEPREPEASEPGASPSEARGTAASEPEATSSPRDTETSGPGAAWEAVDSQLAAILDDLQDGPLRAHGALLHVLSLLHRWKADPPGEGSLPQQAWSELDTRVQRVLAADPESGDVLLIHGLLRYYCADSTDERDKAITELESGVALARGIRLPEILGLIELERRTGDATGPIARYLALSGDCLAVWVDPLTAFLDPTEVEQDLDPYEHLTPDDERNRSRLLAHRLRTIVLPRTHDRLDDPQVARIHALAGEGENTAATEKLPQADPLLIAATAEYLLAEAHPTAMPKRAGGHSPPETADHAEDREPPETAEHSEGNHGSSGTAERSEDHQDPPGTAEQAEERHG